MVSGYNFWLECPTKVRLTQLSYIFKALFRDTPLAYNFFRTTCHLSPDHLSTCHLPPGTWNAKTERRKNYTVSEEKIVQWPKIKIQQWAKKKIVQWTKKKIMQWAKKKLCSERRKKLCSERRKKDYAASEEFFFAAIEEKKLQQVKKKIMQRAKKKIMQWTKEKNYATSKEKNFWQNNLQCHSFLAITSACCMVHFLGILLQSERNTAIFKDVFAKIKAKNLLSW